MAVAAYGAGYLGYDFLDNRVHSGLGRKALDAVGWITGWENIQQDVNILTNPCASTLCKIGAGADMVLNAVLGVSMFSGVGSSLKSIKAAWAMRGTTVGGKLAHLGSIARSAGATSMEIGKGFFRPLGSRRLVLNRAMLHNPWRLAGGFFHELAHLQQEFGVLGTIAKPLQRLSAATSGASPGVKQLLRGLFPTYALNPVEVHAAASGLAYSENLAWLLIGRGEAWMGTQVLNAGCP